MATSIQNSLRQTRPYQTLLKKITVDKRLPLERCPLSFLSLLTSSLTKDHFFPVLLFDSERESEKSLESLIAFCSDESVAWLPFFDYGTDLFNAARFENHFARFSLLASKRKIQCLVTSPDLLSYPTKNPFQSEKNSIYLVKNRTISFEWLRVRLSERGYEATELVEHAGEFCVRGGIIDIYPFGFSLPVRLEFFGDTLESLRTFNPDSQLSLDEIEAFHLFPAAASSSSKSTFLSHLPIKSLLINISDKNLPPSRHAAIQTTIHSDDIHFRVLSAPPFRESGSRKNAILSFSRRFQSLLIFWQNPVLKDQLTHILNDNPGVSFVRGSIPEGFILKDMDAAVVSDNYFFHREHLFNPDRPFIPDVERVSKRDVLKYGDAVVHVDYGVGIYLGTRFADGDEQLILEYDHEDKVYLPVRHIDKVYRFSENHHYPVRPDSLKGRSWETKQKRVQKAVTRITDDLLRLYRKRISRTGLAMGGEPASEQELELSFPWQETRDQSRAIDSIKKDLARPVIMDRLVCGDVGFGKTEVAIRAAYRAVISGFQVAVLVPTTILSIQHYETFRNRLEFMGLNIDILNRFRSEREFRTLRVSVVQGQTDILIGTHKLLSNKLFFKNLGLLIIDEEHRFGVHNKEKIKTLRTNVDVLTLSATPIPRTLQLSLAGIRDITRIDTPPKERIPIYTKIVHWDTTLIQQVIRDELRRDGQILVVNNNISELAPLTEHLQSLIPEIRIRFAHGQLTGKTLENQLIDFLHRKYDVLVSTTIIESGIDIPNANTLIVMNAHRFGLSQLYQIRGRVGRSFRKAYAYLVIPKRRYITPDAMQRLKALKYYTDLGSGYHIAMRDLELRGAGDLFGTEQSGHIEQVGYNYFLKLLSDEIEKRSHDDLSLHVQPDISLDVTAYIPRDYVPSHTIRLELYQSIARAKSKKDLLHLKSEFSDRFGPPPEPVFHLLNLREILIISKRLGIQQISETPPKCTITFHPHVENRTLQTMALTMAALFKEHHISHQFRTKGNFSVVFHLDKKKETEGIKLLLETIMNKNKLEF
jgi:transcription-repair coupling factor (superfamily II helicase)